MPRFLKPVQHHDLHQASNVKAVGGRVESGISGKTTTGAPIEPGGVRQLVDKSSFGEDIEKFGAKRRHGINFSNGWRDRRLP